MAVMETNQPDVESSCIHVEYWDVDR